MKDVNVMGQWLDTFKWTYFITFTTRYELTQKSARRAMDTFYRKSNEKSIWRGQNQTAFTYFVEAHSTKKGYHVHALIYADISVKEIYDIWQVVSNNNEGTNYVRALNYITEFGASYYIAKYVAKKAFDWDFDYRGALALEIQNDLFNYEVVSPFQGWRKFSTKSKSEPTKREGKKMASLQVAPPPKLCPIGESQTEILTLIEDNQVAKKAQRLRTRKK